MAKLVLDFFGSFILLVLTSPLLLVIAIAVKLTSKGNRVFQEAVPLWRQAQQQLAELNGARWIGALRSSLSEIKVDKMNTPSPTNPG